MTYNPAIVSELFRKIQISNNIVIISHKSPDGDSLGSSLALFRFFQKLDYNVVVCHPDKAPYFYQWLTDLDHILIYDDNSDMVSQKISNADLIFCLDFNAYDRLGVEFGKVVENSKAEKVLVDHHQNPSIDSLFSIWDNKRASTSELIFEMIYESNNLKLLDEQIARYLYLGIMTDTGSFRFQSVTSRTHEILTELLKTGMNHTQIHENIYDSNTLDRIRLKSYAIVDKLQILENLPIGIITLLQSELRRFNYQKGDTEGLVNMILSIEKIKIAAIFIEHDEGVKISFRSKEDFYVNELAHKYFNGGGHKYASGGFSDKPIENVVEMFKEIVSSGFYE
jgi:phosphoesterase RecJ-like protein